MMGSDDWASNNLSCSEWAGSESFHKRITVSNKKFLSLMSFIKHVCMLSLCDMVVIKTMFQSGHEIAWRLWISAHSNWTSMAIKDRIQETNMLIFTGWMSELLSDAINALLIGQQMKVKRNSEEISSYSRVFFSSGHHLRCKNAGTLIW